MLVTIDHTIASCEVALNNAGPYAPPATIDQINDTLASRTATKAQLVAVIADESSLTVTSVQEYKVARRYGGAGAGARIYGHSDMPADHLAFLNNHVLPAADAPPLIPLLPGQSGQDALTIRLSCI